ncbi:MAG: hypothetical protein GC168_18720 [Candidatus Hydrogenedens sp.]|nr:hypothetical protein [Candidatus Hydrogenedens sp.]
MSTNPNTAKSLRVQIKNIKSGRYLSVEGDDNNWKRDDASLTIRDSLGLAAVSSPQVWTILQYRPNSYILINQYSGSLACIRARSQGNGATAIQYHSELVYAPEPFQQWNFTQLKNKNWLIGNQNSGKFIGPQARETGNDHYCIQWDDQTAEDSYQEWEFSEI